MSKDKQQSAGTPAKGPNIFQTILVVFLVIAVGLIFGLGQSSLTGMVGKNIVEIHKGFTNADYQRHARVQTILYSLQRGIKPQDMEERVWRGQNDYIFRTLVSNPGNTLVIAKLGEDEGMMPSGDELKALVDEYLSRPVFGIEDAKTLRAAVRQVIEANEPGRSLKPKEIQEFIANMRSHDNYVSRYAPNIVINKSATDIFAKFENEEIKTEEATISTATMIESYKEGVLAEEEKIQEAYETLKEERFVIPRKCHFTCISVDVAEVKKSVVVSEDEIKAYYEKNKESDPQLKKEVPKEVKELKEGEEPPKPEIVTKTLEESKDYIRDTLATKKAEEVAVELADTFQFKIEEESLTEGDKIAEGKRDAVLKLVDNVSIKADDKRLNKDIKLSVQSKLTADDPGAGTVYSILLEDGKPFAKMQVPKTSPFNKEVDTFFVKKQAFDNGDLYIIQIIDGFTEADYKAYDSVKDEVVHYLCAQKAFPDLIKKANEIIKTVSGQTDGTLVKYFDAEANKKWAAQIQDKTYGPLETVVVPTAEDLGNFEENLPMIAYTLPGKGVFLAVANNDGDMKRVTIRRITGHGINAEDGPRDNNYRVGGIVRGLSQIDLLETLQAALTEE